MDELFSEFLNDTAERLDLTEAALARRSEDARALDTAIHQIHAIRGTASFMAAPRITALTEAAEHMLLAAKDQGGLSVIGAAAFARCAERVRGVIAGAHESEPAGDDAALLDQMRLAETGAAAIEPEPSSPHPRDWTNLTAEAQQARETLSALRDAAGAEQGAIDALINAATGVEAEARALRRLPMNSICRTMPHLAEQAANLIGKQVRVQIDGGDVPIEAEIAIEMRAILVHLVRNAVAHGIEAPATRRARGKPETGTLKISARRESGGVAIDVADDGAGLDLAAIRKRGVENGMIGAADAVRLSDAATLALLFEPGFSTARRVTSLSGCGIGLDAVKTSIEKLGGRLEVESRAGAGVVFRMRTPQAVVSPMITLDPQHQAHERLRPLLDAAGYEISEGAAAEPAPSLAPSEKSKEQSA